MGFSDADDMVGDAGPAFDPELVPDTEIQDELEAGAIEELSWSETQIRELLITQGSATNYFLRLTVDDETWKHTEDDLRAIAPPLARILNRYDATRAAAAAGDELALVVAVSNYGIRNYTNRARLIRRYRDMQEPVSGIPEPEPVDWEQPTPEEAYEPPPPNLRPRGI